MIKMSNKESINGILAFGTSVLIWSIIYIATNPVLGLFPKGPLSYNFSPGSYQGLGFSIAAELAIFLTLLGLYYLKVNVKFRTLLVPLALVNVGILLGMVGTTAFMWYLGPSSSSMGGMMGTPPTNVGMAEVGFIGFLIAGIGLLFSSIYLVYLGFKSNVKFPIWFKYIFFFGPFLMLLTLPIMLAAEVWNLFLQSSMVPMSMVPISYGIISMLYWPGGTMVFTLAYYSLFQAFGLIYLVVSKLNVGFNEKNAILGMYLFSAGIVLSLVTNSIGTWISSWTPPSWLVNLTQGIGLLSIASVVAGGLVNIGNIIFYTLKTKVQI
ncbi:hypothetical protein DJ523_00795 [Sulfolobus sp. E5]|nr:hypothetical protein DJ523_00795 [Sulfolobus sp. E5]